MFKKIFFWLVLATPGAVLIYLSVTFLACVAFFSFLANNGYPRSTSFIEKIIIWEFLKPAYMASRNIYQAFSDCVIQDDVLIYKPTNGVECRFSNFEYETSILFVEGVRKSSNSSSTKAYEKSILIVGDSHAMGWGVDHDESFAAHLGRMFPHVQVDNMAVASYGLPRELMLIRQRTKLHEYDLIVLQYCENDLGESIRYFSGWPASSQYVIPHQSPYGMEELENRFLKSLGLEIAKKPWLVLSRALRDIEVPMLEAKVGRATASPEEATAFTINSLYRSEFPPILIFPINGDGLNTNFEYNYISSAVSRLDESLSARIRVVDLFRGLEVKERKALFYTLDDHLNAKGHKFIADKLASLIII